MANSTFSTHPMPMLIIDTCPCVDNNECVQTKRISSASRTSKRSLSLPNCSKAYKDLCGAIHTSSSKYWTNDLTRCHSYPNNALYNNKQDHTRPLAGSLHFPMSLLDPASGGLHSPGDSSSRYSLYGSFFDLSESGYYPSSSVRSERRYLTIDGHPIFTTETAPSSAHDTYEEKCHDWLNRLKIF